MKYVEGSVLQYDDRWRFTKCTVSFENGIIKKILDGSNRKPAARGVIIPKLVNAHTHIGDAVVKNASGTLEELVAPPNGLKFRVLKECPDKEIVDAMKKTADDMFFSGVSFFCDFREFGIKGINQLNNALKNKQIKCVKMGRPEKLEYHRDEVNEILGRCDGIGVSSISDWDYPELKKLARHAKRKNKMFALHVSERTREDIDKVLDLRPDFLVHMTKASESDLEIAADSNVPVVVCPRSNVFFGNIPNIPLMIKKGLMLMLGSDNAMINNPDMFTEMEFAYKVSMIYGGVSPETIFNMLTVNTWKFFKIQGGIEEGGPADFLVLNTHSSMDAIVKCSSKHISFIGGKKCMKR
ncbi:MAG: amidohydrolase family protein [Thermoplasmatales archaeon]|nr:amidohydrolase family protein [Thermoplasmatales archaeon]